LTGHRFRKVLQRHNLQHLVSGRDMHQCLGMLFVRPASALITLRTLQSRILTFVRTNHSASNATSFTPVGGRSDSSHT
jgi:hypothetical protein